jgi:hypothetical protein
MSAGCNPITVSDERLEELRAAYAHLAANPRLHRDDVRSAKDAEHAALFEELQRHRERICRECEGSTFIRNPSARYYRDSDGCEGTNDPEEIDCPRCNGIGYEPPERPTKEPSLHPIYDDEEPF